MRIERPPVVITALSVETSSLARRMRGRPAALWPASPPSPSPASPESPASPASPARPGLGPAAFARALSVCQSGPGAARAARSAAEAASRGAPALVSWGLAGGLVAAAEPGTVILPTRIVRRDGRPALPADAAWQRRLAEALRPRFRLLEEPLLASEDVLGRPAEKARAAAETGAVAVDMESAAVAEAAMAAGVPFVALRVVADGAADTLPPNIERWIDARGNRRAAAVLGAAFRPAEWPRLLVLAARYAAARRTLDALADCLVPSAFLLGLGSP